MESETSGHEEHTCGFVKVLSELPGLQKAGTLEYSLSESDTGCRLCVRRAGAAGGQAACEVPGLTAAAGRDLLQFLYENAVGPEAFRDIVRDLTAK